MALPTQAGTTLQFIVSNTANTGTVSSTITVPADAQWVHVGVGGYQGTANGLAAMTFTKGAADTLMTRVAGGDASISFSQVAGFYLAAPDTGSNKSLKWDWIGTGTSVSADFIFAVSFWKGIDTGSPIRDSDGAQAAGTPFTTPTLTAQTDDLIIAFAGADAGGVEGSVDTWSNLTLLTQCARAGSTDGALATGAPTGNTTVAASTDTNWNDGGIVAVVLKGAPEVWPPPGSPEGPKLRLIQSTMRW